MDTLRLEKPREWKRLDVAEPEPQPGDAVVRVLKVGVCGTDVGGYLGKFPFFKYPRIPGHELAVEVLSLPEGVEHIEVGDLCAVEPYINCQTCQSCRQGTPNCCENHKTLGVMCDGGLTEQIAVPARRLHRANGLEPEQAALVETLAVGCHAVDRGMVAAGESALILGAGPIGLAAYEFVKLAGATPIVADISGERLEFVREKLGVERTILITGGDEDVTAINNASTDDRPQVVIDATGHAGSMVRAMEFVAFGGRVVYVGITHGELRFPHPDYFHRREITLLASRNALSRDFTRIIRLIAAGELSTDPWITHRLTFDDIETRFDETFSGGGGLIKAIVSVP